MKKTAILSIIFILVLSGLIWYFKPFFTSNQDQVKEITIVNPVGPTVIPLVAIDGHHIKTPLSIKIHYWKNIDEVLAMLATNDAQFAVLPVTNAANMYMKNIDLVLLGVHEWKVFYMVGKNDAEFKDFSSLKGKTVYTPAPRGQTADVLMRAFLEKEGLNPDTDVNINYAPPQEIVALFKEGKTDFAALPEPFVTLAVNQGQGKIVLDFQDYWGEITGGNKRLPIAGLFVKREFAKAHPKETEAVVKTFAESVLWANNNPDQAVKDAEKILPLPPAVMKAALTRIDFYFVPVEKCQGEVELFLDKMQEFYPEGMTGVPDDNFYEL